MSADKDPITGQPNDCAAASTVAGEPRKPCWCDGLKVPEYFKSLSVDKSRCLSKESITVLQLVDQDFMLLEKYLPLAGRTECNYDATLDRMKEAQLQAALFQALCAIVEHGKAAELLKSFTFYGKQKPIPQLEITAVQIPLSAKDAAILHALLGMMNELGELAAQYLHSVAKGVEMDQTNLEEEVGDFSWYHAIFMRVCNLNPSSVLRKNIAKLQARYPAKFTEDAALNRDTAKEAAAIQATS